VHIRTLLRLLVAALVASALTPVSAHAAPHAQIEGSGSTWAQVILQQWVADVDAQGVKVTYTGGGASQGRKEFAQNVTDFGVTEIPYQGIDEFGTADSAAGRELGYVPVAGGALVFAYQLRVGGRLVTDLDLSGETVAKIFTNQITSWDDPQITADNHGRALPAVPVTPVVRADGSATTALLTTWLDQSYPTVWRPYFGRSGHTSYFPKQPGSRTVSAAGSDQVMNAVRSSFVDGAIGYVEYSYALNVRQPVVSVGTADGHYVAPSTRATWGALRGAEVADDGSLDLDSVLESADSDVYPLTYVSHAIIPTGSADRRMTTAKRQTLVDFMFYSVCEGQRKAIPYGLVPLPVNLVRSGLSQIAKLKSADPAVDLAGRDISACHNPTFDPITQTDIPPVYPTTSVSKPVIAGLPKVGSVLTASLPSPGVDTHYTYAWNAGDRVIPGATAATYVPRLADVNKSLSVTVMPHRSGFRGIPATSDPSQAVVADAVVSSRVAVKKLTLKIVKAPTRKKSGKARVTVTTSSGAPRLSGRVLTTLTLTLGHRRVVRQSTASFANGAANVKLPKLPKNGRWRVSMRIPRSDLVLGSTKSRPVTVRIKK
jgi:phosphate transport system substrate-binding protein